MSQLPMQMDDGQNVDREPNQSAYAEHVVWQIFAAIGVCFLIAAPVSIWLNEGVDILYRLWLALLVSNLVVWTSVLAMAAIQVLRRAIVSDDRRDMAMD